ncbi:MAG: hypothetical protein VSS75_021985 [Candidatus Parabeggiatoa sp.]|nr:hypothetical protein [Candidatus Parabeggiatoa sp.]
MIEDAPIVRDIRKIRCAISQQFDDDLDQYIDYLRSQKPKTIFKSDTSSDSQRNKIHHYQKGTELIEWD